MTDDKKELRRLKDVYRKLLDRAADEERALRKWCDELARAGARLTALAGGAEVETGRLQVPTEEGTFSEEIAAQRIRHLLTNQVMQIK